MKKVLVLDDDHDIAFVVRMVLVNNGFKAKYITNYNSLEETLRTFEPEILILDIFLGGADGRELCRKVKGSEYGDNLHVILFSANMDASKHYKDYKAEAFIPKPFDSNQLISTINAILE